MMPCVHAHTVDTNLATETTGRRRCRVPNTRGPDWGHRVRIEGKDPSEISSSPQPAFFRYTSRRASPQLYKRRSSDTHHGEHPEERFAENENSDLQSLNESIARAEIEADLRSALPELQILRSQEEIVPEADPCRGRRYDPSADFSSRGKLHPDYANTFLHQTAWNNCGGGSQAHELAREIKDRVNQRLFSPISATN